MICKSHKKFRTWVYAKRRESLIRANIVAASAAAAGKMVFTCLPMFLSRFKLAVLRTVQKDKVKEESRLTNWKSSFAGQRNHCEDAIHVVGQGGKKKKGKKNLNNDNNNVRRYLHCCTGFKSARAESPSHALAPFIRPVALPWVLRAATATSCCKVAFSWCIITRTIVCSSVFPVPQIVLEERLSFTWEKE